MSYKKYVGYIIISFWLVGCLGDKASDSSEKDGTTSGHKDSLAGFTILADTMTLYYPMAIGNDASEVEIRRITTGAERDWRIKLTRLQKEILQVPVTKAIVVDSNTSVFYQDSLHKKYINTARIKHISYDFIRSNSLYFNILFENREAQKEIIGRFNIYYGPKERGKIYGLITDSIRTISSE